MVNISNDTVDTNGAAPILGVAPSTLNTWRSRGTGPKFHRIGGRIRYFKADLQAWLEEQMNPAA